MNESQNDLLDTPLHIAAFNGNINFAEKLLVYGVNIDKVNLLK